MPKEKKYRIYRPEAPEDVREIVYFTIEEASDYVRDSIWKFELDEFTGQQDRKQKDIYEGDVVVVYQKNNANEEAFRFVVDIPDCYSYIGMENCQVIGNIHKNPELAPKKA